MPAAVNIVRPKTIRPRTTAIPGGIHTAAMVLHIRGFYQREVDRIFKRA